MRPIALLLILAGLLAAAPAADAGKRRAPRGFYGVMWDGSIMRASQSVRDAQWNLMARSGVESVRTVFSWEAAQPHLSDGFDHTLTDRIVARAVSRRIKVLPVVLDTPGWARRYAHRASPPRYTNEYAGYLEALVERYGPKGSFWRLRPDLPRRPIRHWQIWNEPHLRYRWYTPKDSPARWPRGYVALLRESARAIRRLDPKAKIVLAGFTNDSWTRLVEFYRARGRRWFDIGAIQSYTAHPRDALKAVRLYRRIMRKRGDRRKPLWATEIGWPAAEGRIKVRREQQTLVTHDHGMASRLRRVYGALVKRRRKVQYRVTRVFWYTWTSRYRGGDIFDYAGLGSFAGGEFDSKLALTTYRRSARRWQGCAKTELGRCR